MRISILIFISVVFSCATVFSQTVKGKIKAADTNEPMPGVNVIAKGTSVGTVTDLDGNFSFTMPDGATKIVISFLGYKSIELTAGNSPINVNLQPDVLGLQEIVVTGQGGGIEKKRLSTTVDIIQPEQLAAVPASQLDRLLQGQLPSTQIKFNSGQPGTGSIIRSRGVVSAASSSTPVIYVDGVRVDNLNSGATLSLATGGAQSSSLPDIPVENIDHIEFVKGGAATTLYGSDAANGAIQIFTKKGSASDNYVTFETQQGINVGTKDYLRWKKTGDLLYENGAVQTYRFGFGGGNEQSTYSFSGSITGDDGYKPNTSQKKYNFRTSVDNKLSDKVSFQSSFGYSHVEFERDYNANTSFSTYGNLEGGQYGDLDALSAADEKALQAEIDDIQSNIDITEYVNRFQTAQSLVYNPINRLTTRFTLGIDSRNSKQTEVATNAMLIALGSVGPGTTDQGTLDIYDRSYLGLTGEANAQYTAYAGSFSFISTLGTQLFRDDDRQVNYSASNVAEGSKSINNAAEQKAQDFRQTLTNYGFYGLENIGFQDKYFLELGLRVDGNSAFGDNIGLQAYPKIGFAYDLTSEEWFSNAVSSNTISNLKLRANYGIAGRYPTPFSEQQTVLANTWFGELAYNFNNPGNPDIRPEKVTTIEGGFDMALLNYRVTLAATYYTATTNDALFLVPPAPSTGQASQLRNVGTIFNKGYEISTVVTALSTPDYRLKLNASLNGILESVVEDNGGTPEFVVGGFTFLGAWVQEGETVGYFRGDRPIFDANGNLVDVETNASLGSPIPDISGSLGIHFTMKDRLSFYATADYQKGAQGINVDDVLRYFSGLSDEGRIPDNSASESFFSLAGVWVEDTDYLKVRNISVFYDFSGIILPQLKKVELGFAVANPFNFYSSTFDPEVSGNGARSQGGADVSGFGFGTESPARTYLGTLRVSF